MLRTLVIRYLTTAVRMEHHLVDQSFVCNMACFTSMNGLLSCLKAGCIIRLWLFRGGSNVNVVLKLYWGGVHERPAIKFRFYVPLKLSHILDCSWWFIRYLDLIRILCLHTNFTTVIGNQGVTAVGLYNYVWMIVDCKFEVSLPLALDSDCLWCRYGLVIEIEVKEARLYLSHSLEEVYFFILLTGIIHFSPFRWFISQEQYPGLDQIQLLV